MICHNNPIAFLARQNNEFLRDLLLRMLSCHRASVTKDATYHITVPAMLKTSNIKMPDNDVTGPLLHRPTHLLNSHQCSRQWAGASSRAFLNIWSISGRSFSNNRMVAPALGTLKVGSKGLDWSLESIHDPWYGRLHPRAALTRAF